MKINIIILVLFNWFTLSGCKEKDESIVSKKSVNSRSSIVLGGWESNYGSWLDVDKAAVFGYSMMYDAGVAPLLDVFFDDSMLWNTAGLDQNPLPDTGVRFGKTDFTGEQFDKISESKEFENLNADQKTIMIKAGDVVVFQNKAGKKGLLKIVSMTSPGGDLVVDEKIQIK